MLELKAAPSQNPIVQAAQAAAPAPTAAGDGGGADAAALQTPGMSFAAMLKQHIGQGHEKKAAALEVLLAAQVDAAPVAAPETVDPISLLAPMLMGIAPPAADTAETTDLPVAEPDAAAVVIAAPAAAVPVADDPAVDAPVTSVQAAVDDLPQRGEKAPQTPANIAAQPAARSEGDDASTAKRPAGFDELLNTTREAQVLANPTPVRSPHAATPAAPSAVVSAPVGTPRWGGELADKVVWMVGRQETRAELVLNPPQLGRVEVSVSMNGDQANATFISANASVREALENAMPRLREVLQNAGISLGQAQVGAESFRQSAEQRQTGDNPGRGRGGDLDAPHGLALGHETAPGWLKRGDGLVDTFA